ncbi:DUF433 domain-containing protein [Candidatus Gottesmanbacteria bacterium]|nr:DUF433 domain-containing protein [Candidatus Gottesmanbacteria bacterium]
MKQYITSDTNILSGAPVIAGTRVPVARILYLIKDGYSFAEILKQYPHLNLKTLKGVIAQLAQKVESKLYAPQVL